MSYSKAARWPSLKRRRFVSKWRKEWKQYPITFLVLVWVLLGLAVYVVLALL